MSIIDRAEIIMALGKGAGGLSDQDLALIAFLHPCVENLVENYLGYKLTTNTFTEDLPDSTLLPEADDFVDSYELVNGQIVPWFRIGYWERRILQLRNLPVRSIIAVYENLNAQTYPGGGYWPPESQLVEGRDFFLDRRIPEYSTTGRLVRRVGTWLAVERSVRVIYTSGYSQTELAVTVPRVRLAVLHAVISNYHTLKAHQPDVVSRGGGVGAITGETLGDWSQQYGPSADRNFGMMVELPDSVKRMLMRDVSYAQYI